MTKNIRALTTALRQSINEAILESNDVATVLSALHRAGKCPVFTVDISLEDAPDPSVELIELPRLTEDLVLSDSDVELLAAIGISDPSWCVAAPSSQA